MLTNGSRRHLKSHDFHACPKCFTRFVSDESLLAHGQQPCVKSCSSRKCKRYRRQSDEKPAECQCVISSTQQWQELHRLQFTTAQSLGQNVQAASLTIGNSAYVYDDTMFDIDSLPFDDCMIVPPPSTSGLYMQPSSGEGSISSNKASRGASVMGPSTTGSLTVQSMQEAATITELREMLQGLQNRVQALEEQKREASTDVKVAIKTQSEKDLELVVVTLWETIAKSTSPELRAETRPSSSLCRLVKRLAPGVLDIAEDEASAPIDLSDFEALFQPQ